MSRLPIKRAKGIKGVSMRGGEQISESKGVKPTVTEETGITRSRRYHQGDSFPQEGTKRRGAVSGWEECHRKRRGYNMNTHLKDLIWGLKRTKNSSNPHLKIGGNLI